MFFLKLFQILVIVLLAWLLISQVLIPAFKGQRLFPFFNKRRAKVLDEVIDTRDELEIQGIEKSLEALKTTKTTKE